MTHADDRTSPGGVLHAAYGAFMAAVREIDDERSWAPTGCTGWAARDLVFHCLTDAQRALNALHTPTDDPPDRDAVSYWADWRRQDAAGRERAAQGRRFARTVAGMFLYFGHLRELYLETAAATLHAAGQVDPHRPVVTQGHVLSAGDLLRTLAVEATVHHLDLGVSLTDLPGPSSGGLAEVRRTLDGLLGRPSRCHGTTRTTPARPPAGPRSPPPNAPLSDRTRPASPSSGDPSRHTSCPWAASQRWTAVLSATLMRTGTSGGGPSSALKAVSVTRAVTQSASSRAASADRLRRRQPSRASSAARASCRAASSSHAGTSRSTTRSSAAEWFMHPCVTVRTPVSSLVAAEG
ncbi:maleylpyruvate isomerase N-terminal domain-containing protein [Streptomyces sp. NPDC049837]|uniref:maleylpyruvate isomerase N-terminal domain-containing protein n=1 Tax=Streptomyces sp. NPDC049837 TaxID=3155277 RepID=UPI003429720B